MKKLFGILVMGVALMMASCGSSTPKEKAADYCAEIVTAKMNGDKSAAKAKEGEYKEWLKSLSASDREKAEKGFKHSYAEAIAKGGEAELSALADAIKAEDKSAIKSAYKDFDKKVSKLDEDMQKSEKKAISTYMKTALKDKVEEFASKLAQGLEKQDKTAMKNAQKDYESWAKILPEELQGVMDPVFAECVKTDAKSTLEAVVTPLEEAYRTMDASKMKEALKDYKKFQKSVPESAQTIVNDALKQQLDETFDPICDEMISDYQKQAPTDLKQAEDYIKEYTKKAEKVNKALEDDEVTRTISDKFSQKMNEYMSKVQQEAADAANKANEMLQQQSK